MVGSRGALLHVLATIAYRSDKALRGAPPAFGGFQAGHGVRTPTELVRHMSSVLAYARAQFGGTRDPIAPLPDLEAEAARLRGLLRAVAAHLEGGDVLVAGTTEAQLLQGPLADALTHAGQLALLRRLAGSPIPAEDFTAADVRAALDAAR